MPKISRRNVLLGGAAVAGAGLLAAKPGDNSGPRDPYFLKMQKALTEAGIAIPTLVIDQDRLDANIDTLMGDLPEGMGYRIVAKSLPSLELLKYVADRSGTDRLMTFNLPMLSALSNAMPTASQLLGKPLPVQAAKQYFEALPSGKSSAADNIQWLIDTPERLKQYEELAKTLDKPLKINLELDVGLHRGGFVSGENVGVALDAIKASKHLSLAGLMGYEPHIPSIPSILGWRESALQGAWDKYSDILAQTGTVFDASVMENLTRNAAGSPTYRYYKTTKIANEISAGSCLVKPTHFDTELLAAHQPSSFVATPVLKSYQQSQMAGLEFADGIIGAWDPNTEKTIFTYGGNWMADLVDPPGLQYNPIFGRSSNQELINGGSQLNISPDEFVFLRPTQSEAFFMQFGDIAIYKDGAIVDHWSVFSASA